MSGCVSLGATAIMLVIIYYMVRAFTSTSSSSGGLGADPDLDTSPQTWGTDPQTGREVKVQIKGGDQWQWANVRVPMARQMPGGLIIGVRPNPRVPLQQGAMDERAFYAIADAVGKNPEKIVEWATPENRHAVLSAWWQIRQGFQIRGATITANLPVQHGRDPRIHQAVSVLSDMARQLSSAPEVDLGDVPAPVLDAISEPVPVDLSGDVGGDPSGSPPAVEPVPVTTREVIAEPEAAPELLGEREDLAAPAPVSMPAATSAPSPAQAPAPTAPPRATSLAEATQGLAAGAVSPFAAAPLASRPTSSSGWPGASAPPAPAPAPVEPTPTGGSAEVAEAAGGDDVTALLTAVLAHASSADQEAAVKARLGERVAGAGKVSFSSKIYGTDLDLGEKSGFKVTLDVPVEGAGIIPPKVLMHVAEDPGDQVKFGAEIRFSGAVAGFKAMGKTLLLKQGRIG